MASAEGDKLSSIFLPHLFERRNEFLQSNRQFVHYTTGENALRILTERKVMMRSTVCMNDYTEVQHGHGSMLRAFQKDDFALRTRLITALDAIKAGIAAEAIKRFDGYFQ